MSSTKEPFISNTWYDFLKKFTQLYLPAAATLYFTLANIWNLPGAENVVATAAALATFLGVILQINTNRYQASESRFDGTLKIWDPPTGPRQMEFEVPGDPNDLEFKDEVTIKVQSPAPKSLRK